MRSSGGRRIIALEKASLSGACFIILTTLSRNEKIALSLLYYTFYNEFNKGKFFAADGKLRFWGILKGPLLAFKAILFKAKLRYFISFEKDFSQLTQRREMLAGGE